MTNYLHAASLLYISYEQSDLYMLVTTKGFSCQNYKASTVSTPGAWPRYCRLTHRRVLLIQIGCVHDNNCFYPPFLLRSGQTRGSDIIMSSDTWTSITSWQDLEQLGRRVIEWCKEHPIKFSAYATFILLSLFPVFVFLLFTICSIIGTVLFLVLLLLIGLIILAAVCSIVLCCSGCVAASVTVAYLIMSVIMAGIKWIIGLFSGSTGRGDSLKES